MVHFKSLQSQGHSKVTVFCTVNGSHREVKYNEEHYNSVW